MPIQISNVTRRAVYAPTGAGGAGPYAFTFEILAAGDIAVYKDDVLLTLTTHYTVTINSNGTGSVTITSAGLALAPASPTQYAIVGNRTISRTTDYVTGGDFFANTLNDELDQQTIFNQQNAEGLARALQAPQTDPTSINMTLPRATLRANKALGFDANGNPTIADTIGTNRGNWTASTLYYVRDIVKDTTNNNIWQCIVQHTSSGSQPINTNADSAKWTLLVDAASATTSATNAANSATAAATSASNASTSATNAASSASAASTSATNAASSASTASTQATNASNSATAAASSASTASTAATNASSSATAAASSASSASTSATNAASSASSASTSASNASTSATNAANSASTATTQATNAASSASSASTSATNAANSATAAQTAQTAAEAAFDSFDDRYLGAKSSNPTVDNDGNPLVAGALYFNSVDGAMKVYTGSAWVAAYVSGAGFLATSNNLSELSATASTARTNLGLGSIATQAANNVSITGGSVTGITDLAVADGGTGASTATNAKVNLEVITGSTGSARIPSGTTGERDGSPGAGYFRFNSTTTQFEGYNGTAWGAVGGGNTTTNGLWENANTISANYTIGTNNNALSAGPITVNSGVTVTVPSGSAWTVV